MRTQDFDFYLPDALIAQFPSTNRSDSRMLRLDGKNGHLHDNLFKELPSFLQAGDLLVLNDTRVIKARLFGQKASGGAVEVMIERVIDEHHALAQIRASRAPKAGSRLILAEAFEVEILDREDDLFRLSFLAQTHSDNRATVLELLEQYGTLPLPPYIEHSATSIDDERYQTVFSKNLGAVAAPTAGLHFDDNMLKLLKQSGVNIAYLTLHVGAGTFQPVRVDEIAQHKMHSEIYSIPAETVALISSTQQAGGKVTAIGTTVLRALESAAQHGELQIGSGETKIFITPGYQFKVIDRLFTNFHLPQSTLLMLVSAFAGFENAKHAYQHAIEQKYRFFSYGDAMLIEKN